MPTHETELPKAYAPAPVEGRIYRRWLESGAFTAPRRPRGDRRFSMVMPPPNVTGHLHMGHALDNTLQDVFARWHRMMGDATLWLPGTDHAGIATQAVVEKRLVAEGLSRRAIGRDAFLQRVWRWKDEYEAGIVEQLRRLGCSCDWSRQRFTLDAGFSRAVEEVFVRYHREGLLYRGDYLVNWCPSCGTAISDLEVEHEPEESRLYRIRYPLDGGGDVVVATVRPETMLGDAAVAVHPADERYRHAVGRKAVLPLIGRRIPVVADPHVDPSFGTGALKVTPAHDADDAAIAARHGLPSYAVIGTDGRLTADAGPEFAGLPVAEARAAVVAALRSGGFLGGEEPYIAPVGRCTRCAGVVEPLISRQWFVRMRALADAAAEAVRAGRVRFVPERFSDDFLQWMDQAHDWCISRQLWWGHRIPAYECAACGETTVSATTPAVCPRCGAPDPERDPDVLDTWFSSALWPFSTLGWPAPTASELTAYYPTDLLVTGRDILFFWVARMIFSAVHLTGEVPFRTVLLHGLVRDAQGRKMSKSLGNGIDPLQIIDRYGADALRLTLLVGVAPGNDSRFAPEKIEGSQHFCNKLWNAARFSLGHLMVDPQDADIPAGPAEIEDRWIESRMAAAVAAATSAMRRFDPGEALAGLQSFVWDDFCDWYLEAVKPRLFGNAGPASAAAARRSLGRVLGGILRLLHPFLPFITEEIWARLTPEAGVNCAAVGVGTSGGATTGCGTLLMTAPWPAEGEWPSDPAAEVRFGLIREIAGAVRSLRAEMRVPPAAYVKVLVHGDAGDFTSEAGGTVVRALARVGSIERRGLAAGELGVSAVVGAGVAVVLLLQGAVDAEAEIERLRRERDAAEAQRCRAAERLSNPDFLSRAKQEVVQREQARRCALEATVARLEQRIAELSGSAAESRPADWAEGEKDSIV